MSKRSISAIAMLAFVTSGCSYMYGGSIISDETLRSDIAGVLGTDSKSIQIESRRSEGVNTYTTIKTTKGTRYACTVTGGGVMVYGMKAAPTCNQIDKEAR